MTKPAWIALGALAALVGCGKQGLEIGKSRCVYEGKNYQVGATFPASDGCNTCNCMSDGTVGCTVMYCFRDAGSLPDKRDSGTPDLGGTPDFGYKTDLATSPDLVGSFPDTQPGKLDVARDGNGDAGLGCLWLGTWVPAGQSVYDGCNTCSCGAYGMACTARYCPPTDAQPVSCTLPGRLTMGYDGGLSFYEDGYVLDPSGGITVTRFYGFAPPDGGATHTCTPALPACGAPGVVSVSTIVDDLAAPELQSAFSATTTPMIYGYDRRPMDGRVWSIALTGKGTMLVGDPCPSPIMSSCRPIPPAVQRLADDLKSLTSIAGAACGGLL